MANPATCLETDGERIVVPRPNKMMQALVNYLNQLEYEIYVISASNQYSVVYIAKTFFGIPESHVFGMKPTTHKNQQGTEVLGNEIEEPGTVGEGKALTYWKFIGHIPPLITAGDSTTDLPILKLTHHLGLCIWVGKDKKVYEHIKKECNHPQTTFFLFRDLGF
jgi:phosphoserine phosphatase